LQRVMIAGTPHCRPRSDRCCWSESRRNWTCMARRSPIAIRPGDRSRNGRADPPIGVRAVRRPGGQVRMRRCDVPRDLHASAARAGVWTG
jgi:hypothetical protein